MSKKEKVASDLTADAAISKIFGREVLYELKRLTKGKPVKKREKKKSK